MFGLLKKINVLELFAGVGGFPCQDYSVAEVQKGSWVFKVKKGSYFGKLFE